MPKLRANPSLTGGQIRLRSSRRIADLKWLGVIAVMLAATAFDGLPMADIGRAAVEMVSRGGQTIAVAADADQTSERPAGLLTEVSSVNREAAATDHMSDIATAVVTTHQTAGLFGRAPLKVQFCPWLRPGSNS